MLENPANIGMTRRLLSFHTGSTLLGKFDSEFPMTNQKPPLLHRKNLMLHRNKNNTMLG
jgi:hypothetical protein